LIAKNGLEFKNSMLKDENLVVGLIGF